MRIYLAKTTKDLIKTMCKNKKINMEDLLEECSLGINAVRQINDTKGMASFSLAKIADVLDCSVDYLLGRTDNPNSHRFNLELINDKSTSLQFASFSGKELNANLTLDEEIELGLEIDEEK